MTSYKESEEYLKSIYSILSDELKRLDESIIKGRDSEDMRIPISTTRYRIKSCGSAFLKMRRKNKKPEDIFDYAGIRILCLFEQDIPLIHKYLLRVFKERCYTLKEITGFNWNDSKYEHFITMMNNHLQESAYNNIKFNTESKDSGYKSVHYIILFEKNTSNYPIEIQLRTIFQDAWGELEHALSYKQGNIHPHIKECFIILANDIESNDALMDHLKKIYNSEKFRELYSIEHAGPFKFLDYSDSDIQSIFKDNDNAREQYESYVNCIKINVDKQLGKKWVPDARKLLAYLKESISLHKYNSDKQCHYFFDMEDAFIKFREGALDEALSLYKKCNQEFNDRYVPYFRIGEIKFIKESVPEAIANFDQAEHYMQFYTDDYSNKYKILSKIAHVYWLLGAEYINLAVNKIEEAGELLKSFSSADYQKTRHLWLNNYCYYLLENYLHDIKENNYSKFKEALDSLSQIEIKEGNFSSNDYDTLAWGYYNVYLKTKDKVDLERAKSYCENMVEKPNTATFKITSHNIQMNHFLEIMRSDF